MKKSKSRAIRRRSARKIRGGAHEIIKADYKHIAPEILKSLISAAIFSAIMRQNIQESTAMFVNVLRIIAGQLTETNIGDIFPDATRNEVNSMIDMLNGKSTSFHRDPATLVIGGGSRRRNKRLRSKTHKHQIQSGGTKNLIYMVVSFFSACYFIYIGIMGMTTRHVAQPLPEFSIAGEIFRTQYTGITAPALLNRMDDWIGILTTAVAAKTEYSGSMIFNSRDLLREQIGDILHTPEIIRIIGEIMHTVQDVTSSSLDANRSNVDMLRFKSNPLVSIIQDIIRNTLPQQIVSQINSAVIKSAIRLILGSGLGWLVYGLNYNGHDAHQIDGDDEGHDPPQPPGLPPPPPGLPPPPFPSDRDRDRDRDHANQLVPYQQPRQGATSPTRNYNAPDPLPTKNDAKARPPYKIKIPKGWFGLTRETPKGVSPTSPTPSKPGTFPSGKGNIKPKRASSPPFLNAGF